MFSHTAQYYDTISLAMKDYGAEAEKLTACTGTVDQR
jgi:hypothetical protein